MGTLTHDRVPSLQLSNVQPIWSLQLGGVPDWHPSTVSQVSAPLQYCSSSHREFCGALEHESVASLHESTVQGIPSLQLGGDPDWQPTPTTQASPPLQYNPSEQVESTGV